MPRQNKRKATAEAPRGDKVVELVVFKSPGAKPDVRLHLFGIKEFHVHSTVLKLHSNYFRKFMDSAEKTPAPPSAVWKYDYVSVVDEDGEWGLEVCGQNAQASISNNYSLPVPRIRESEADVFEKLLNAMYSKPTVIESSFELHDMTRLADFYCALPVLSTSLYTSFWSSPKLLADIASISTTTYHRRPIRDGRIRSSTASIFAGFPHYHPVALLKLAAKLRQPLLFREMMVYVVSLWEMNCSDWEFVIKEAGLLDVVTQAYNRVYHLQARIFFNIFCDAVTDPDWREIVQGIVYKFENIMGTHKQMEMAFFCKSLLDKLEETVSDIESMEMRDLLHLLLKSNLVLDKGACISGQDKYFFQYLCAEVEDAELPWDLEETDW